MAVDINEIYKRFSDAATLIVGASLGSVPTQSGTAPAIFKAKDRFPAGIYPMILINVGTARKQGSHTNYVYYNTALDTVYQSAYDYFVTYTVYTEQGGNAQQIADDLKSSFVRNDVLNIFSEGGFGTPAEVFEVNSDYFKDGNEVREFANFNVRFTTTNRVVETEPTINTIDADLRLRYPDSETDILTGTVRYPTP